MGTPAIWLVCQPPRLGPRRRLYGNRAEDDSMEDVEMRVVLQAAGVAADAILAVEHKAQGSRPISTPCAGTLESSLKGLKWLAHMAPDRSYFGRIIRIFPTRCMLTPRPKYQNGLCQSRSGELSLPLVDSPGL